MSNIGRSMPRIDARAKVAGTEKYSVDYYSPKFLWAGVKRAGIPHAVIKGIEVESARKIPGVIDVLTYKDVRGSNRQGVVRKDQPVLADDRVRHCGDALALVIAEDKETINRALEQVVLDYDPLPAVFDPEDALKPDAPLVHEDNRSFFDIMEKLGLKPGSPFVQEDNPEKNLLLKGSLSTGDAKKAFNECNAVVKACFEVPFQEHAYLETEAGWAVLNKEGTLEIVCSTQTPFRDRTEVAEAIGIEQERIRIIAPYCGGAFGGKDGITVQSLLALAALRCPGRPVKMWWNREESFVSSAKRHRARLYYRLGAKPDGRFHALEARIYYDTGPYDHLGGVVMALGLEHSGGPYRIPNTDLKAWSVYTNNPVGGAFRGFGVVQATAAMEQMVDMLAVKLGISPLELRLCNTLKKGDKNPIGVTMTGSTGIEDCLRSLKNTPLWKDRENWKASAGQFKRRGTGIAAVMQGMGYGPVVPDIGNARIELTEDGKFRVYCGVVDMGQGNATTYAQIACEVLNQDISNMELVLPDTSRTLPSGSASASRTTYTFGNAVIGAAEILKERIVNRANELSPDGTGDDMALIPGGVRNVLTGEEISLAEIVVLLDDADRKVTFHFQAPVSNESPSQDPILRLHGVPHVVFSFGAHAACVELDELTGRIEVKKYIAVTDCGRIINPQLFEQQMHGGIAQGIGYALMEDLVVEDGVINTRDLATYVIPGAMDIPDMDSVTVDSYEKTGPFGLKGAGEISCNGPLAAIANALADACGVRVFRLPMIPERVLAELHNNK